MNHNHADRPESEVALEAMATKVRLRRKEIGMTQAALAGLAGCNTSFVRDLEQGKETLRLDKVVDVLAALGLTLEVAER